MNRNQWFVLGIGLFMFGYFLFSLRGGVCWGGGDALTACMVRRYAYVISGLTSITLGIIFALIGFLESKR